jgi:hypothetical protein
MTLFFRSLFVRSSIASAALLVVVGAVPNVDGALTGYTDLAAWNNAVTAANLVLDPLEDFESYAAQTTRGDPLVLGNISYTQDYFIDAVVTNLRATSSGSNSLGLVDNPIFDNDYEFTELDDFVDSLDVTFQFATPRFAFGIFVILEQGIGEDDNGNDVAYEYVGNEVTLDINRGGAEVADDIAGTGTSAQAIQTLANDRSVFFLGAVDPVESFDSIEIDGNHIDRVANPAFSLRGAPLNVGPFNGYYYNVDDIRTAGVPEPNSFALLLCATASFAARRRRRR